MPPFSVLDARQGYWQERKRFWLAKGIKSEIGRGGVGVHVYSDAATISRQNGEIGFDGSKKYKNGLLGFSEQARSHYKNASPGGSPRPACDYSHRERGDGAGRPIGDRLTWVTGNRPDDELDEVSRKILAAQPQSGTSIFDPVLCELIYRWFTPPGGHVLDPFAGGSVRGIVAALTGFQYTGVDLRPEQIAANKDQWDFIGLKCPPSDNGKIQIKVSAAMARTPFHGCDPDYIRSVCHASCCQSSTSPSGTIITIHPDEEETIRGRGGSIKGGLLETSGRCPFKTDEDLCGLHFTTDKPFGCIASPFTLNDNNTLIVRNRYKLLKCYNQGERIPAYRAFRASLDRIFGDEEAGRICDHFDAGGGDLVSYMPKDSWRKLRYNDTIKHGGTHPRWIAGDSQDIAAIAPGRYDLIFSCPPYFDLERYSDDPRDLSTMDYEGFLKTYRGIVAASVGMLKPDRFACFVVGDIRDRRGFYRNFVGDTIEAFQDAGATLYNEAVLITSVGSLPIRVNKQFQGYRKLGKTHQNVLVFYKGDPKNIKSIYGDVDTGLKNHEQESLFSFEAPATLEGFG